MSNEKDEAEKTLPGSDKDHGAMARKRFVQGDQLAGVESATEPKEESEK